MGDSVGNQLDLLGDFSMAPRTAQPVETSPLTEATHAVPAQEASADSDSGPTSSGPTSSGPTSLLILDTETSGLDPAAHACLEQALQILFCQQPHRFQPCLQ